MQHTKCACALPRGTYNSDCPACRRREAKAETQRERRFNANQKPLKVSALQASAMLHGWHDVTVELANFGNALNVLSPVARHHPFTKAAKLLYERTTAFAETMAGVLDPVHELVSTGSASDCIELLLEIGITPTHLTSRRTTSANATPRLYTNS
jgi:hypothetical protein